MREANHSQRLYAESGFTLLELLITLALLSMLSLTLLSSLHYGSRIWEASHRTAVSAEAVREAQAQLAAIISAAYPKFTVLDARHAWIAFDGEPSSLQVLAPDPQVKGAMDEVTVRADASANSYLVIDRRLELSPPGSVGRTETLLGGLQQLRFDYFGPAKRGARPSWEERWREKSRPPLLVRIRATLQDRRISWPDLIVAPQIAADVSCTLDAITKFCEGR